MKVLNIYIVATILIFAINLNADKLYFGAYSSVGGSLHATEILQIDDYVEVNCQMSSGGGYGGGQLLYKALEIDAPTLVTKVIVVFNETDLNPILVNHLENNPFDYGAGDGWVDTVALGWVYIRFYPWVWDENMQWVYVLEGPASSANFDAVLGVSFYQPPLMVFKLSLDLLPTLYWDESPWIDGVVVGCSFFLWSPQHGWLLKSELSDWIWSYDKSEWINPSKLE